VKKKITKSFEVYSNTAMGLHYERQNLFDIVLYYPTTNMVAQYLSQA